MWDFPEELFSTEDLSKALEYIEKLEELGFDLVNDDAKMEMQAELNRREEKRIEQ